MDAKKAIINRLRQEYLPSYVLDDVMLIFELHENLVHNEKET